MTGPELGEAFKRIGDFFINHPEIKNVDEEIGKDTVAQIVTLDLVLAGLAVREAEEKSKEVTK